MADKRKGLRLVAEARLVRYEARIEKAMQRALKTREARVLSALTAAGPVDPFNEDTWPDQLAAELKPALDSILEDIRSDIEDKAGTATTRHIDTQGQLDRMLGKMEGLGPDTAARLERELGKAINNGESVTHIKHVIRDVFDMAERSAATIARTETGIAVSSFSYESALAIFHAGTPMWHTWLATDDARTRPTHNEADGQTVALDQPFSVGGAAMLHPHDPAGPVGEVVNCRCSETYATAPPDSVEG